VKAGHVYAVAHVRGGGENGAAWWQAGKGPHKGKGVEDFIACARQLVAMKFTSRDRLAASGASAGGLLIGGAVTTAPQQFGAAVIHAGMVNPVRLLAGANGANQISELGDPRTPAGLKALQAMDPYQRVRTGTAYPAVLLSVGSNDSRVSPWESAKFGARLAAASSSGKPVWFRVSDSEGHFAGSLQDSAAELADTYTFLELQLGAR
jgi:prolyl oligopeptidase